MYPQSQNRYRKKGVKREFFSGILSIPRTCGLHVLASPDIGTLLPPYSYPSLLGTPLLHSSVLLLLVPPGLRILVSPDLSSFLPSYSSPCSSTLISLVPPGPPYPHTSGALYPRTSGPRYPPPPYSSSSLLSTLSPYPYALQKNFRDFSS